MNIFEILVRSPINKLARSVTSQRHVAKRETPLSRKELVDLLVRIDRKQKLLRRVLQINTASQHTNLMHKRSQKIPNFRQSQEPRAYQEYVRLGKEMLRMQDAIRQYNDVDRAEKQARRIAGVAVIRRRFTDLEWQAMRAAFPPKSVGQGVKSAAARRQQFVEGVADHGYLHDRLLVMEIRDLYTVIDAIEIDLAANLSADS